MIIKQTCSKPSSCFVRLYTGIHAKPKPKFKTGAISESTTALNVDPTNASSLNNTDLKNTSATALPLACPTAHSNTAVRGSLEQQLNVTAPALELGVGGSGVAAPAAAAVKKEAGPLKMQVDKKKIDARKKSLKRL